MIGNDVVDLYRAALNSPDSFKNGRRYRRFLEKFFSEKEQHLINTSKNEHQTIWLLWSMKEAAYKIFVQQLKKPFYNPKRITCVLFSKSEGVVNIENATYKTTSNCSKAAIYTTATTLGNRVGKSEFFQFDGDGTMAASEHVRSKLIEHVSKVNRIPASAYSIQKSVLGIPKLYLNNQNTYKSISLTHHGRFLGYAISS